MITMTVPHMPGRAYLVPGFRTCSLLRDDHLRTGILLAVSPDISGSGTLLGDGTHMEVFPRVERPRGEHGLRASSSGATRDARAVVNMDPIPSWDHRAYWTARFLFSAADVS